jgi:hypothetical protein
MPMMTPLIARHKPATTDAEVFNLNMATHSSAERKRRTPPEILMVRLSFLGDFKRRL